MRDVAATYTQYKNINYINECEEYKQKAIALINKEKYWTGCESDQKIIASLLMAGYSEKRVRNALRKVSPYAVGLITDYYIDKTIEKVRESLKH